MNEIILLICIFVVFIRCLQLRNDKKEINRQLYNESKKVFYLERDLKELKTVDKVGVIIYIDSKNNVN